MSDHVIVTIAVPAAHIADANELARCLGYSAADGESFGTAAWQDGEGHLYAVASGPVRPTFVSASASPLAAPPWGADMAIAPLAEPAWGADMEAAARAQGLVSVYTKEISLIPFANPEQICAVIGLDAQSALSILGLTQIERELNGDFG